MRRYRRTPAEWADDNIFWVIGFVVVAVAVLVVVADWHDKKKCRELNGVWRPNGQTSITVTNGNGTSTKQYGCFVNNIEVF